MALLDSSATVAIPQEQYLSLEQGRALPAMRPKALKLVRNYVFNRMHKVKGYLGPVDAFAIAAILEAQQENGLTGSMVEIGTFYGRLFFLMQLAANGHGKFFAADTFDIGPHRNYAGQYDQFVIYGKQLGLCIESRHVFVGDSKDLSADHIRARVGTCRFFHIDGGHEWKHVVNDAQLALDTMADYGVIAFDDFYNPEWPDVTVAVMDLLASRPDLKPFAITNRKLYVAKADYVDAYRNWVCSSVFTTGIPRHDVNLFKTATPFLKEPFERKVGFFLMSKFLRGFGNGLLY
jgi:hypothetical protein